MSKQFGVLSDLKHGWKFKISKILNFRNSMESQPQNPEFRINPENFHSCRSGSQLFAKVISRWQKSRLAWKEVTNEIAHIFLFVPKCIKNYEISTKISCASSYGPRRDKTCLRGFPQNEIQTSVLSYSNKLKNWNFARSKSRYYTFKLANNKGAGKSVRMLRLVCTFVVCKPPKTGFLVSRLIC